MPDESGEHNLQSKKNQSIMERLFKSKSAENEQKKAEEDILSLLDRAYEKGFIEDRARRLVQNIFDFDDTSVGKLMTHRTEMTAAEDDSTLSEIVELAIESGYSRIPVYHEDIDNIKGVLYVKDLLKFVGRPIPSDFSVGDILREALFVPKTKNCSKLFGEMVKNKIQLAIVIDEYGGTEGLITLEDLIEEILGNIQDEYDDEQEDITKISDTKFTVDGTAAIEDIESLTGLTLSGDDCETVAGYILEHIERVPSDGEHPVVESDGLRMTVTKIEDRRITQVEIEKL